MSESARNPVHYSDAEKISFEIVPKTCVAIEKALDLKFNEIEKILDEVLPKYRVFDSKELRHAFAEVIQKVTFSQHYEAQKVIKFEGTYPLRLALVQMIERELLRANRPSKPSIYSYWIDSASHKVKIKPNLDKLDLFIKNNCCV